LWRYLVLITVTPLTRATEPPLELATFDTELLALIATDAIGPLRIQGDR
jgi:hypothetical protein